MSSANVRNWRNRRLRVFERDNWTCVKCGVTVPEEYRQLPRRKNTPIQFKITVDHRIPKSKGGDGTAANLQAMCFKCNGAKSDTI